jgi:hypothetical protein
VKTNVDQPTERDREIVALTIEGFGKGGGDRVGGLVDDASVALKRIAAPVIVIGQEPSGSAQRGEELVGVLAGALLALCGGAQPEPRGVCLQPGRSTSASVAQPAHKRTLDRKDALLPAGRRRRDTPRLTDERVVEPAEIDLDRWCLDLQILPQTAERHPRSSCWPARHRAVTLPRGPDAHEPSPRQEGDPDLSDCIRRYQKKLIVMRTPGVSSDTSGQYVTAYSQPMPKDHEVATQPPHATGDARR